MEFITITTALLGIVMVYLVYWLSSKKANYWKEKGVPCTNSFPIIGSMTDVILGKTNFVQLLADLYNEYKNEKYFGIFMFHAPVLVIRDPELISQVLIKDFSFFQDRTHKSDESDLFSSGIQNLTGDKWRVLRHKLTPTFTSGKMKLMFKQIKECCDEMTVYLKEKKGQDFESRNLIFNLIINIIATIAFGLKVNAFNDEEAKNNAFLENSKMVFKPSIFLQVKLLLTTSAPKIKKFFKLKLVDNTVNDFFPKLINDLISYRESSDVKRNDFLQLMLDHKQKELEFLSGKKNSVNGQVTQTSECDIPNAEPEDLELLQHLKRVKYDTNSAVFSDNIIAGQTFVFISGGSETISAALSFTLHELAVNRDIQRRLQEEIDSALSDQELTYESLKKMTYMEQILNEVMRLRPGAGFLSRVCTQDYKMPGSNLVIDKGSIVHIPVLGLHKDPQYFPDPEKFNPDRFKNMDEVPKGVFFPFGGGPRMCIAMRLAMLEMKIFLAILFSSFNVVLSEKTQLPIKMNKKSILQHVVGGLWVRFEPREIH
ncbi:putative cytochrome P450 6a14 [Lycorma delicatula]|uniref:putative cytochrome P450 6a14 n=1 Tax=Lycorma delicatula TaxID=130591 RepID=UPI003F518924